MMRYFVRPIPRRYDIGALRKNSAFAEELSREVGAGRSTFCRGMRVGVSNMDEAVVFWTRGCGAQVQSTRMVNGRNTTAIGFGSQSLRTEDGAKFSLELVEGESTAFADDHPLQYLQLAIPVFRLSQVREFGGELVSAYGWSEVIAPGGLPLRVRIDESRRDPFEVSGAPSASRPSPSPSPSPSPPWCPVSCVVRGVAHHRRQGRREALREPWLAQALRD